MVSKIVTVALLFAYAQALPLEHQATAFTSFNKQHNTIHHIQSAPVVKAAVASAPVVHSGQNHVAPVEIKTAAPHTAQSYSSLSFGHSSTPVAHHAVPIAIAQPVAHEAPVVVKSAPVVVAHHEEKYAPAKYEFAYGVQDHHTGDFHSHKEARDGDHTQGEYSLHEADGTIRTVKYTVDKHSGFNAVVERTGHAVHAQSTSHH